MVQTVTGIVMEVIRLLTFQQERPAPPRHRKAAVNHSDTGQMR